LDKLQKWAHFPEIAGAAAVVVSLLYAGYYTEFQKHTRTTIGTGKIDIIPGRD